jgi:hypothetical protein
MAAPLYVTQSGRLWHAGLILIVTVGLPGISLLPSIQRMPLTDSTGKDAYLKSTGTISTLAGSQS